MIRSTRDRRDQDGIARWPSVPRGAGTPPSCSSVLDVRPEEAPRQGVFEGRDLPRQHAVDPTVKAVVLGATAGEDKRQSGHHEDRSSPCSRCPCHICQLLITVDPRARPLTVRGGIGSDQSVVAM